jgi:hypothetical protein
MCYALFVSSKEHLHFSPPLKKYNTALLFMPKGEEWGIFCSCGVAVDDLVWPKIMALIVAAFIAFNFCIIWE